MTFYSSIVKAYDQIFPPNKAQSLFMEGLFANVSGKHVLDCGCGTGSLAIELGRKSARVDAFDLDEAMITKAKEKCPQALNVKFSTNDLLKFGGYYQFNYFDLVYCLGNTLPHLPSLKDVQSYFDAASLVLKEGAWVVVQIVNYDWVQSDKVAHLPTIDTNNYTFERNYIPESNGAIQFSTVLTDKLSGESFKQSVPLLPILKDDLRKMLANNYTDVQFFGSFKKDAWSKDSFYTVVVAKKSTGPHL